MSFLTQAQLAIDPEFRLRVQHALAKIAIAVFYEDVATPLHTERTRLATHCLRDTDDFARKMAPGLVTQPDIDSEATDTEIENAVSALWNAYASAF